MGKASGPIDSFSLLTSIVRFALRLDQREPSLDLDENGWRELIEFARRQSVAGLVFSGINATEADIELPESALFPLVATADSVARRSARIADAERELLGLLSPYRPTVIKGSSCAARYPDPQWRESGDIDLYFPQNDVDEVVSFLKAGGYVPEKHPDGSVHFSFRDTDVDIHSQYYDLPDGATVPPIGTPDAELLMLSAHILKHFLGSGVGLKPFCDIALAIRQIPDGAKRLTSASDAAGIGRWNKLLLSFLQETLDPSISCEHVPTGTLRRCVIHGGNFGQYSPLRRNMLLKKPLLRKADSALRLLGHAPRGLHYSPRMYFSVLASLVRGNLD